MIVVRPGMYSGRWSAQGYVGSNGGSTHDEARLSRMLSGTGGKRRRVSLITARTEW